MSMVSGVLTVLGGFAGICLLCFGCGKPENRKFNVYTGISLVVCAVIAIADEFIGTALLLICLAVLIFRAAKKYISRRDYIKSHADRKLVSFYEECRKNKVFKCSSEKEIQKASLIAENMGLEFSDIAELYAGAAEEAERLKRENAQEALSAKKKEEELLRHSLEEYSELRGRDKRTAMLREECRQAREKAKALRSGADALINASQQKEIDWAVHGGIASGIAGGAAGLAAAVDDQLKNARIRQQNEANLQHFAPVYMDTYSSAADLEKKAEQLEKEIEATKTKLITKTSPMDCVKKIKFTDTAVSVSETGTCTVTTKASLRTPFKIYGDTKAVIDGTIIAKIYEGDELTGIALMVLPAYGLSSTLELKGMCPDCGKPGDVYRVEFAAANLWEMER